MTSVRVGAWQMTSGDSWPTNQSNILQGLAEAKSAQVKLLVLPENMAAFSPIAMKSVASQSEEIITWLSQQAAVHGLYVLAGTLPLSYRPDGSSISDGRFRSASLLFSDRGELVGRYDKRHLFDANVGDAQGRYQESARFEPGQELALLDTPWGGLGVLTCYDIRFPEQARAYARMGAQLLAVPAAFTAKTGQAHWQTLLKARAIENQCLVIGAGQSGWHNAERQTWGHSQIIDAWGQVLAQRESEGPGLVYADWNLSAQDVLRQSMPVLHHRLD
ncbi:MAG: carbon-nitrogen hydrolase family protein [Moraxellaceae bacterium]|nr:carbon-nitrogen hydrolase family protein [Moraxellaceae bacterium]MDZ4388022.1 carbon-nitrogen hydrolase family protein [Moraxellaceae bacterium]